MTSTDPLTVITGVLHDHAGTHPETQARHVLAALQGLYVPPPPGTDRDKLPDWIIALIQDQLRPYTSTGCETAQAIHQAAWDGYSDQTNAELAHWEQRLHASCRRTRKQDMARCRCRCHTGRPEAPAVERPLSGSHLSTFSPRDPITHSEARTDPPGGSPPATSASTATTPHRHRGPRTAGGLGVPTNGRPRDPHDRHDQPCDRRHPTRCSAGAHRPAHPPPPQAVAQTGPMTDDAPLPDLDPDEPAAGRPVPCDMCGRPLTGATARRRRLGDDCWHKMHPGPVVRTPGRFDVEQDGLF